MSKPAQLFLFILNKTELQSDILQLSFLERCQLSIVLTNFPRAGNFLEFKHEFVSYCVFFECWLSFKCRVANSIGFHVLQGVEKKAFQCLLFNTFVFCNCWGRDHGQFLLIELLQHRRAPQYISRVFKQVAKLELRRALEEKCLDRLFKDLTSLGFFKLRFVDYCDPQWKTETKKLLKLLYF